MRYGIPILGDRVAPRCTSADSLLMVDLQGNDTRRQTTIRLQNRNLVDLVDLLSSHHVDALICGGISRESKEFVRSRQLEVINNVACTVSEVLEALRQGKLQPGFGLSLPTATTGDRSSVDSEIPQDSQLLDASPTIDCLACTDRVCQRGGICTLARLAPSSTFVAREDAHMLEAALDIACEEERTLCRLSELIYFCLEMKYHRLGLAFCVDLEQPAEIVTRVLRRFFVVHPVSCKVGGQPLSDPILDSYSGNVQRVKEHPTACNPRAQAEVLNQLNTDLNILVGVCMGSDCIFTRASHAPVTTLFVKDRSLVNNPIAAVYSDYYLNEAIQAAGGTGGR